MKSNFKLNQYSGRDIVTVFVFTAIFYPLIGYIYNIYLDTYDPIWHRLLFSVLLMTALLVTLHKKTSQSAVHTILYSLYLLLFSREIAITYINHMQFEYVLGVYIILAGSGLIFVRKIHLLEFYAYALIMILWTGLTVENSMIKPPILISTLLILLGVSFMLYELKLRFHNELVENKNIMKRAKSLIFIFDTKGCLVSCSKSVKRVLGISFQEIREEKFWDYFKTVNVDTEITKANVSAFMEGDFSFEAHLEVSFLNDHAEELYFVFNISKLNRNRAICIATDISGLKRKNIELNDYTNILTTNIRGPVESIRDITELISSDFRSEIPLSVGWKLNELKKKAGYLQEVTDSVVYFSDIERENREKTWVDLKTVMLAVSRILERKEHVKFEFKSELPEVFFHESKLFLFIYNIAMEASRYCGYKGGVIELGIKQGEGDPVFYFRSDSLHRKVEKFEPLCNTGILNRRKKVLPDDTLSFKLVKNLAEKYDFGLWVEKEEGRMVFYFQFNPRVYTGKSIYQSA